MTATQDNLLTLARLFAEGDGQYPEDAASDDISGEVTTRDTFDDFRKAAYSDWAECGSMQEITMDGLNGLFFDGVQIKVGTPRVKLAVLDCGDFRLVYSM